MSCLFDSIGRSVNKPGSEVRNAIMNYIVTHLDTEFNGVTIGNWLSYVRKNENYISDDEYILTLRRQSTWGGGMELAIASLLFNTNFIVHFRDNLIAFDSTQDTTTTTHLHYTGGHYEYLMKELIP